MTETTAITAHRREVIGKANRRMVSVGQIPAVLYGAGRETLSIALDRHAFELMMAHHGAGATLVSIAIEGEAKRINAMIREVQTSPVKGTILHVDFQVIRMDQVLNVAVPLRFVGDAEGVKAGGIFMQSVREVTVEALPADLPDSLDVDISALEIGHTLTVADVVAIAHVTILDDPETVVCSITTPVAEPTLEELSAVGEAAEPTLVGKERSGEE
ncbi:MAG: 50S ribosomal protein L25 [Clostridiales bacterium]|nr:50S ribosomal protein L25 [Clostridiales bacterium]